jgi:hypothetical protein
MYLSAELPNKTYLYISILHDYAGLVYRSIVTIMALIIIKVYWLHLTSSKAVAEGSLVLLAMLVSTTHAVQ